MITRKFLDELYARKHEFESGMFHAKQKMEQAERALEEHKAAVKRMTAADRKARRDKLDEQLLELEQNFYRTRHSYCVWDDRLLHLNRLIDVYVETHQPESKA